MPHLRESLGTRDSIITSCKIWGVIMSEKQMVSPPLQYPQSKQTQCVFDNLTVDTEKGISLLILNRNKGLKMNTGLFHKLKCKLPLADVH